MQEKTMSGRDGIKFPCIGYLRGLGGAPALSVIGTSSSRRVLLSDTFPAPQHCTPLLAVVGSQWTTGDPENGENPPQVKDNTR